MNLYMWHGKKLNKAQFSERLYVVANPSATRSLWVFTSLLSFLTFLLMMLSNQMYSYITSHIYNFKYSSIKYERNHYVSRCFKTYCTTQINLILIFFPSLFQKMYDTVTLYQLLFFWQVSNFYSFSGEHGWWNDIFGL